MQDGRITKSKIQIQDYFNRKKQDRIISKLKIERPHIALETGKVDNNLFKGSGMETVRKIFITALGMLPKAWISKTLFIEFKKWVNSTDNKLDDNVYVLLREGFEGVGLLDDNDQDLKLPNEEKLFING